MCAPAPVFYLRFGRAAVAINRGMGGSQHLETNCLALVIPVPSPCRLRPRLNDR